MKIEDLQLPYPNTVFRYRSYSPLTLNELLYSEIFFSSKDELNDPYDTKNPHHFESDIEIYKRLINLFFDYKNSIGNAFAPYRQFINIDFIAAFFAKEDMYYNELVGKLNSVEFEAIVFEAFNNKNIPESAFSALTFIKQLKLFVFKFLDQYCYIASFSMTNNDPVLWSHYADHHKGFCLCFSIVDGTFKSDKSFYPHGIIEHRFEEVHYEEQNVRVNGFYPFPGIVYGKEVDRSEIENYWQIRKQAYLTKFTNWQYEREVRLIRIDSLPDGIVNEDGLQKKSIVGRIFNYDPQQLTGIIFGTTMGKRERQEVREIIYKLREYKIENDCRPLFIFYEAIDDNRKFEMSIRPIDGIDTLNKKFNIEDIDSRKSQYITLKEHYLRNSNK
jgi:hypothetical protein